MHLTTKKRYLPLLLAATLVSCSSLSEVAINEPIPVSAKTISGAPSADSKASNAADVANPQAAPVLQSGTYCYSSSNESGDFYVRLMVDGVKDGSSRVEGDGQVTVRNKSAALNPGYRQKLNGTLDGGQLNLETRTWREVDQQDRQETWQVRPTELTLPQATLPQANCEQVNKVFQDEKGLEAKDLIPNPNKITREEVFFSDGEFGTMLSGTVVQDARKIYILNAQGGQEMKILLDSEVDNAVFDLVAPSGLILSTQSTEKTINLPHTGDYEIIVGSTNGEASYTLKPTIE